MTKSYNVSVYGMSRMLQEKFKTNVKTIIEKKLIDYLVNPELIVQYIANNSHLQSDKGEKFFYLAPIIDGRRVYLSQGEIYKIAKIVYENVFEVYPQLQNIYDYFIKTTEILSIFSLPVTWFTPNGAKILQRYLTTTKHSISLIQSGRPIHLSFINKTNFLNKQKQIQGILPNVIHSLDSAHLINLILEANMSDIKPILTIHDCFGTSPNQMELLDFIVKKTFIALYSQYDFLMKFHEQFISTLKLNNITVYENNNSQWVIHPEKRNKKIFIPEIPIKGNFDLNNVLKAPYFIN